MLVPENSAEWSHERARRSVRKLTPLGAQVDFTPELKG
jgi:hypothetical protein